MIDLDSRDRNADAPSPGRDAQQPASPREDEAVRDTWDDDDWDDWLFL